MRPPPAPHFLACRWILCCLLRYCSASRCSTIIPCALRSPASSSSSLTSSLSPGFKFGPGVAGLLAHLVHEWVILTNLFLLLIVFGLLSRHFEKTRIPAVLPRIFPHDWKGAFWLLVVVFVLSSFLDNIAAALIGGAMAHTLFRAKVHIGYLAAIVAASNAGGSGSVIGDTTTTMMWIDGVSPRASCMRMSGLAWRY